MLCSSTSCSVGRSGTGLTMGLLPFCSFWLCGSLLLLSAPSGSIDAMSVGKQVACMQPGVGSRCKSNIFAFKAKAEAEKKTQELLKRKISLSVVNEKDQKIVELQKQIESLQLDEKRLDDAHGDAQRGK